jgi:hypothetical protein
MKYDVELAMMEIDNYWCQKPQLTGISCDHLFVICSFRKLDYTQYISPYYSIQYYTNTSLVIDIVMIINEIGQCITIRSLGQIQQKSAKERE